MRPMPGEPGQPPKPRASAPASVLVLVAVVVVAAGLRVGLHTPTAGALTAAEGVRWALDHLDYAPSGMPDFSLCRPVWSQPGAPAQWTYAGPVALADALWWLDSAAEPRPRPPSEPNDGHGLVTAYPHFGPPRDDHDAENLTLLVEDLAFRLNTDGRRETGQVRGTRWEDLVQGASGYLAARNMVDTYRMETSAPPSTAWVRSRFDRGAGAVLLLGVWEQQGEAWRRIGGHYAAMAGIGASGDRIALADPLADAAALGAPGRTNPDDPTVHSCRLAPRAHDDAAVSAHDVYRLDTHRGLPEGHVVLAGYFTPVNYGEAAAFQGQNQSSALADHAATWQGGPVVMAVDAALAIVPKTGGAAVPTPDPATTLVPSPTETVTPAVTATPEAGPTPSVPPAWPWPTATPVSPPLRSSLFFPRASRG